MSDLATLWHWTPFLAGGFAGNLLISVLAMLFGTLIGAAFGWARGTGWLLGLPAGLITGLCRNVPSFVLMFYVAFVLPVEVVWGDAVVAVPLRAKAVLALTIPVIGFASDQSLALRRLREEGVAGAGDTFLTAWLQYFLIILMASATASVIGADEIVARANRVIATDQRPEFLMAVYLYVASWFLVAGLAISGAAATYSRARRRERPAVVEAA
jgi:polar amino acid transport system permease protein